MRLIAAAMLIVLTAAAADARVVRLRIERREVVPGRPRFGAAGAYEKLVGTVEFALDPNLPRNDTIVDLKLAPRNASGEVEASADFYMLKPLDPSRGNGRLFYEVGNRGGKSMLATFQKAAGSHDPTKEAEFGDGALMRQGFTLLWMGWQWDVPERPGMMRMEMPIATENGRRITGLVRGNFILNEHAATAPLADRDHKAYPVLDRNTAENVMTVRDDPDRERPDRFARSRWHFVDDGTVALDGGFEPGRIYDVVYRSADPRIVGFGLSGTRDLVSFVKNDTTPAESDARLACDRLGRIAERPVPSALSLSGLQRGRAGPPRVRRRLRSGWRRRPRIVQPSLRPGVARRAAVLQHPVSGRSVSVHRRTETDPETGATDSLLARAERTGTAPKIFHLLTNSEYFNRAGSLVHTDPARRRTPICRRIRAST